MMIYKARLKTNLRQNRNLEDSWSINDVEPVMALSAKPDFAESFVDIILNNKTC